LFVKRPRTISLLVSLAAAALLCGGCGGSGQSTPATPTTPTSSPASPPSGGACGAITGATGFRQAIVNGTACPSANSPVVLVNLRASDGRGVGECSGTIIDNRAVLTAAHCLVGDTAQVKIWPGSGDQVLAESFHANPNYRANDPSSLDVGVVLTTQDLPRTPVPLLVSRGAVVGDPAIIAGWGENEQGVGTTLRAGTATISRVASTFLETEFTGSGSTICSGDSGGPLLLLSQSGVWAIAGVISATSSAACTSGTGFYANVQNPSIMSFILGLVPNARQQ
jgi:hypothetical protein